jgi:glycosyltransferase involved in cell wall biosynthesis
MGESVSSGSSTDEGSKRRRPELISVVIPARNAAETLAEQLDALAGQTYRGTWEVVIVDNGSNDATRDVALAHQHGVPELRVVEAPTRGINRARNVGVASAHGDYVVFCDADDVVAPGWLEAIAEAAPHADIIAGDADLEVKHDFMAGIPGGNCGMWTSVARELGWDEQFKFAGSDIEFSWRAQIAGFTIAHAPEALVHLRDRRRLVDTARQWYQYGRSGGQLYRVFRNRGMPRSSTTAAVRGWGSLALHVGDLVRGDDRRRRWVRMTAYRTGRVAGSVRARVLFL